MTLFLAAPVYHTNIRPHQHQALLDCPCYYCLPIIDIAYQLLLLLLVDRYGDYYISTITHQVYLILHISW
jgi:hypothetical protein